MRTLFMTVVIRDESPLIHLNEPVSHRTVKILLTEEQRKALELRQVGINMGSPIYESYSMCILEESAQ